LLPLDFGCFGPNPMIGARGTELKSRIFVSRMATIENLEAHRTATRGTFARADLLAQELARTTSGRRERRWLRAELTGRRFFPIATDRTDFRSNQTIRDVYTGMRAEELFAN
jgi:hypothetical protein